MISPAIKQAGIIYYTNIDLYSMKIADFQQNVNKRSKLTENIYTERY